MVRIYTRGGDRGDTALFGGRRVRKDHHRVDAYGTVDELNAAIGLVRVACRDAALDACLDRIQQELFELGADLADPAAVSEAPDGGGNAPRVTAAHVERLEREIDGLSAELPPLDRFILPGGGELGARLHLARTIARRAERRVVALAAAEAVNPEAVRYLNRLSDWLFVAARIGNLRTGARENTWEG